MSGQGRGPVAWGGVRVGVETWPGCCDVLAAGWSRVIKKPGIRNARLHDARHTAATTLLLLGVSERAVSDIMG
ncbi:MAG: hypothetical protein VB093_08230 [Propionicimonas sp.]|nr:hypothetical protein [Propionicimonas sp.]MEA5116664.1 hypothetical protein [Propionicimonas sp.]